MGQDATTIDRIAGDMNVMTKLHLLGLTPSERVKAQKKYLTGIDQESPPADLSGFAYSGARMTVTETIAEEAAKEQRHIERSAEDAYAERYQELLDAHGITEDLSHLDRWVPPYVEDAVRAAEEQFAKDYPNAMPVAEEPVGAPEPAPVVAEELAEEPAPKPAHEPALELVDEPEPEPELQQVQLQ